MSSPNLFAGPLFPADLRSQIASRYATFTGWRMEAEGEAGSEGEGEGGETPQSFTQADVDRIVRERVQREKAKYADYDDLKTKAGNATTLEERVAQIERQAQEAETRAMRAEVANAKGLTPNQAKRLVGATREELEADADELLKDIGAQQKRGNRVPTEGKTTPKPGEDPMREYARSIFGSRD
jgi:hypothetical protein